MLFRIFSASKGFIGLSILLLLMSSCRKEIILFTVKEKQPYLDQLMYRDNESQIQIDYKYSSDNILSGYTKVIQIVQDKGSTEIALFKRDKSGLITQINKVLKDTILDIPTFANSDLRFYYNEKKQLRYRVSSINILVGTDAVTAMDSIIYTYDNKISKFEQYVALLPDGYQLVGSGTITYDANGNKSLVKVYEYVNDVEELTNEINLKYDQNPKSLYSNDDALALDALNAFDLIDVTSTFNITGYTLVDPLDASNNEAYDISYAYATDHKKPLTAKVKLNSVEIGSLKFTYSVR
ncbi:MAG: hypothetical protein ACO29O_07975 [Chitinophagaceae bacterium]